jgi:hypothetical protein
VALQDKPGHTVGRGSLERTRPARMVEHGNYLYCLIEGSDTRNFGPIGIGGRDDEVTTISYQGLSAVISNVPLNQYVVSRETMTRHEKVIEEVMKDCTVLPVRFYTVAPSVDEIRTLLKKRYAEFKGLFRYLDNKVELGLKALWTDVEAVFREIVEEDAEARALREKMARASSRQADAAKRALGARMKALLGEKKAQDGERLVAPLRRISLDVRLNKTHGDDMICNAAFLVDRRWEREFDTQVDELMASQGDRVKFIYVGPAPPYSFVNVVVNQ